LRTSLGNVAYFQDDYTTAIAQFTAAYDNLDSTDLKAWALYRIALSQQRQGHFDQADKTFALVQQNHANTIPAQRAREHQGAKAFFVQLATFAQPASADHAIADLKKQGVTATRVAGPEGHALLRVGPIASYSQAVFMKDRFAEKYPDAGDHSLIEETAKTRRARRQTRRRTHRTNLYPRSFASFAVAYPASTIISFVATRNPQLANSFRAGSFAAGGLQPHLRHADRAEALDRQHRHLPSDAPRGDNPPRPTNRARTRTAACGRSGCSPPPSRSETPR
jgi:tetratricopeptide (TPR) repeat protein